MNKVKFSNDDFFLKVLVFTSIYSNVLRVFAGRWITLIADVILVLSLLLCLYSNGEWTILINKKMKIIWLLIITLQIISVLQIFNENITNRLYSLIEYRKSFFQLIAILVGFHLLKMNSFIRILKYIEIISLPAILYGIKQYFYFTTFDFRYYAIQDASSYTLFYGVTRRAISFFSGPFHYGMLCSIILCITMYLFFVTKKRIHILLSFICLLGTYCSATRTNYVSSLIVLFIYLILYIKRRGTVTFTVKKIIMLFICVLLLLYVVIDYANLLENRNPFVVLLNTLTHTSSDNRFMGRVDTWYKAIEMIRTRFILGNGIGSAADTMATHSIAVSQVTSHNMFVKVFVELGLIGFLIFFSFLLVSVLSCFSRRDNTLFSFALSFISVVLINSLVGSTISTYPVMLIVWLLMGLTIKQIEINKSTKIIKSIKS